MILEAGGLVRLGGEAGEDRLVFRHDRVRDHIRALGLRCLLREHPDHEVLSDPAYAELWGLLIARPDADPDWVDSASALNPLALFQGIAEALPGSSERRRLTAAAKAWLHDHHGEGRHSHLRWAAQFSLTELEGADVAELIPLFHETTWWTREAAAWNGDMESALRITTSWDPFQLRGNERRLFDQIRARHGEAARSFVEAGLHNADARERWEGLLGIAGRLADPALKPVLLELWEDGPRTPEFINAMLWARAFCAPDHLDPVFDAWADLSEDLGDGRRSPRSEVGYDSRFDFWRRAGEIARIAILARARDMEGPLSFYLGNLLEGWDHPDAQEHYVRLLAKRLRESRSSGGNGLVGRQLGEVWGEDRPMGSLVMSDASLARIQALWSDPAESIDVQTVALRLWGYAARPRHLSKARALLDPLGPHASDTVTALIRLNAPDAPAALDAAIEADPSRAYLWQWVGDRWREPYYPFLVRALERRRHLKDSKDDGRFSADHALPNLMRWLDDPRRERLLIHHWDHLGDEREWISLALWTATPASLALAEAALGAGQPSELLKYFGMRYGLYPSSQPPTAELRRIAALEPWLDDLDESALGRLEEHCNRQGWRDWRRRHLDPRLEAIGKAEWRTAASWRKTFDRLADEGTRRHVHFTLQRMVEMVGDARLIFDELEAWVTTRADVEALRTVCECIVESGTRRELAQLERLRNLPVANASAVIDDAVFALKRSNLV